MENFIENISRIGNAEHTTYGSYYFQLSRELREHCDNITDDDIHELICRLESFIEQEIKEIKSDYEYLEEEY
jgi:hypothetical protein